MVTHPVSRPLSSAPNYEQREHTAMPDTPVDLGPDTEVDRAVDIGTFNYLQARERYGALGSLLTANAVPRITGPHAAEEDYSLITGDYIGE